MKEALRTVVIGFGRIGAGYADDPVMGRHYRYATHAQVLRDHPAFDWCGVVDVAAESLDLAGRRWSVPHRSQDVSAIARACSPEVAVLATPPETRLELLRHLPEVRAVLVEKPLGRNLNEGEEFLRWCAEREIAVQVNLWRRADRCFRALAAGELERRVGVAQMCAAVYGNGLLNNGTHIVDFVRMLLGEVVEVQAGTGAGYSEGPITGDLNVPFLLRLRSAASVAVQPVSFRHYRENGLDIWGERGRLTILQEGLDVRCYPRRPNRAMQGEREVDSGEGEILPSTVGTAMYEIYDNLAAALGEGVPLWSPGESALQSARVVQAVFDSLSSGGPVVPVRAPS